MRGHLMLRVILERRRKLQDSINGLLRNGQLEAAAEAQSPDNIADSYRAGLVEFLDLLTAPSPELVRYVISVHDYVGIEAIKLRRLHYDYIRVVRDPKFSPQFSDIWAAVIGAANPSPIEAILGSIKFVERGVSAKRDLERMAAYLSRIQHLDTTVENSVIGPIARLTGTLVNRP